MVNCFIIIATYNAMPWLQSCLDSTKGYPVVVVDNASQDETVSFIKSNYPNINLLPQNENLGFGQANNIGIKYALKQGAERVFLLNQDAYLVDNALEQLINTQQKHPEYGILSPIHLNGCADDFDKNFYQYLRRYNADKCMLFDNFQQMNKNLYQVSFVNAAAWLISKACLEKVGGFDPLFFHYGEDRNYCNRVLYHQFKIGVFTKAFIKHDREKRKENLIEKFSKKYYEEYLRYKKIELTNPFIENINTEITHLKNALLKKALKNLLQLNFKTMIDVLKKYNLIKINQDKFLKSYQFAKNENSFL